MEQEDRMISLELHFRMRWVSEGQGGTGRSPDLLSSTQVCLGDNVECIGQKSSNRTPSVAVEGSAACQPQPDLLVAELKNCRFVCVHAGT